ncbi:aspartate racemase [Spirochaetota bacterium]|nr:aspartate racemase [Spirochaetota bacterium]
MNVSSSRFNTRTSSSTATQIKTIGIIGGVGPVAGVDIIEKICIHTVAKTDQEHIPIILFSKPNEIADRTEYLLHTHKNHTPAHLTAPSETATATRKTDSNHHKITTDSKSDLANPGLAIGNIALELYRTGAQIIGIPCNTAHAPPIFHEIEQITQPLIKTHTLKLINMITATLETLVKNHPHLKKIGLFATQGTYSANIYEHNATKLGLTIINPQPEDRKKIHDAIYHPAYGIKAHFPVTRQAITVFETISKKLIATGAEAIIMGCTEVPLAMKYISLAVPKIDPTEVLARTLIYHAAPHKLKPL